MKQNDGYQAFDEQVQQLLGQASEPVPEGAWEAIAARLATGAAGVAAETAAATRKAVILKWVRRGGIAVAPVAAAVLLAVLIWERPEEKSNDLLAEVHEQGAVAPEQTPVLSEATEPNVAVAEQSAAIPEQKAAVGQSANEHSLVSPDLGGPASAAPKQSAADKQPQKPMLATAPKQSTGSVKSATTSSKANIATPAASEDQPQAEQNSPAPNTVTTNETNADQSTVVAPIAVASTQSIIIAQAEPQTVEVQATAQPTEAQSAKTLAEAQPAEVSAEPQPAEIEVQPIDWDHLPEMEEEPQAKKHKKYQPNGFHLAAYTNALSNFTSKKSGQYTGYSGASGSNIPDHSHFKEKGESSYTIPLTFGINFTYDVLPKLSVGLGVNYTRLSRHFSGTYYQLQDNGEFDSGTDYDNVYNIQQFIGIPVSVYYHIVRTKHINFYVYANGTVEKCIGNAWTANSRAVNYNEPVKGVQFNAGAGIGVDFILAPLVSIYLDPNVKYYFGLNQPTSIRTKQPFMLGFEAGVRFHL